MTKLRAVLKRRWPILAVCLVLGVSGGAISSEFATNDIEKVFTAQQVIVANSGTGASSLVAQDALKVNRGEVAELAKEKLDSDLPVDRLSSTIVAVFDSKTSSIMVTSNDVDPTKAARRVKAFVEAFLELTNERLQAPDRNQLARVIADLAEAQAAIDEFDRLHPEFTGATDPLVNTPLNATLVNERLQLKQTVDNLDADRRVRELNLLRTVPYDTLGPETPKPAQSGLIDVPASRTARAGLVGFLGLLLGGGLIMMIERLNRRIDTREELVDVTDLPVLAEIGFVRESRRAIDSSGRVSLTGIWAEPYRRVRSAIQFVQAGGAGDYSAAGGSTGFVAPPGVFLVTSTSPGEGKSTTSALAALALSEVGVPTVLVGGDFRKPQVDRLVGVPRSPSLQDLARLDIERPSIDEVVRMTDVEHLYVAGADDPTREVAGLVEAAKSVCLEAVARGATVVIDSSPLQAANDTLDLLPVVDYVILVLRVGQSSEADLLDTIDTLRRLDAQILGIVLIGTPTAKRQEYYYSYYSPGIANPGSA